MSTVQVNTLKDAAGSNSMTLANLNQGRVKAWFNLDGTGTIASRDNFSISSFVDNGTGDYTANYSVPFLNNGYAVACLVSNPGVNLLIANVPAATGSNQAVGSIRIATFTLASAAADAAWVQTSFLGDI